MITLASFNVSTNLSVSLIAALIADASTVPVTSVFAMRSPSRLTKLRKRTVPL